MIASVKFGNEDLTKVREKVCQLLTKYPQLSNNCLGASKSMLTEFKINTGDAKPVFSKCRPIMQGDKRTQVEKEILAWEKEGIIERVSDEVQWASPVHAVPKKDKSWRVCGDFRRLNSVTKMDKFPLPDLKTFNSNMSGSKIFSKIDLRRAYHQVPVAKEDQMKTVINTTLGLYKFLRMPFGLKNAGQCFMRNISSILSGMPFLFVYMDDVIIMSPNLEEHVDHIEQVFKKLSSYNILVNDQKCEFVKTEVEFLGHKITQDGIEIPESRVDLIMRYPEPKNKKQLERFLGLFAFVHRFIPKASGIVQCLHELRKKKRLQVPFEQSWTENHSRAFESAKTAIRNATALVHPNSYDRLEMWTDASDGSVGAVIVQKQRGYWRPVAFWSKTFNSAQQSYSTFDKELLAVSYAARHFRDFLEGMAVTVRTDHKPLVGAIRKSTNNFSALQRRHLNYISQFVEELCYLNGEKNVIADACSRIQLEERRHSDVLPDDEDIFETDIVHPDVCSALLEREEHKCLPGPSDFFAAQCEDEGLQAWIRKHTHEKSVYTPRVVPCGDVKGLQLWADAAKEPPRILVPSKYQEEVFNYVHCLSHMGPKATLRRIKSFYYWPAMQTDIYKWAKRCVPCQRNKIGRHTVTALQRLPKPTKRFSHIHVDIVGPLNPVCEGKNTLFTIIDRWSGWPEAVPMSCRGDASNAKACAKHLINHWVSRFGIPDVITSDRGSQFVSSLWKEVSDLLGVKVCRTTSYHPQSNGKVERMHRSLKNALRSRLDGRKDWLRQLPFALLGLRSTPNTDTSVSPALLVYGQNLDLPGLTVFPREDIENFSEFAANLAKAMSQQRLFQTPWHGREIMKTYVPKDLMKCKYVLVRIDAVQPSLNPRYNGPFEVISRDNKVFKIALNSGIDDVSIDRLIPFYE